jgi:hypothetical protein
VELVACKARLLGRQRSLGLHFRIGDGAGGVIGFDLIPVAAQQFVDGFAHSFAHQIPEGHVYGPIGIEGQQPAPAVRVQHLVPDLFIIKGVFPTTWGRTTSAMAWATERPFWAKPWPSKPSSVFNVTITRWGNTFNSRALIRMDCISFGLRQVEIFSITQLTPLKKGKFSRGDAEARRNSGEKSVFIRVHPRLK